MLKQLYSEKNIQVKDIWNMDETGIATGLRVNGLVMGASEKRKVYVRGAGNCQILLIKDYLKGVLSKHLWLV